MQSKTLRAQFKHHGVVRDTLMAARVATGFIRYPHRVESAQVPRRRPVELKCQKEDGYGFVILRYSSSGLYSLLYCVY